VRTAGAKPAALAGWALAALALCANASATPYEAFGDPQPVTIAGYSGGAMEPFISSDGMYLLFNTPNTPPSVPALQVAVRSTGQAFEYVGELAGANEAGVLSGTPTMDLQGNLYFVSPRSYPQTLSTIYTGAFSGGSLTAPSLVPGISGGVPGLVDFDVEASPDGATLYVSVGHFGTGSAPTSSSIAMFDRVANGFQADPHGPTLLKAVNRLEKLDYAASISPSGLELFFTRASPTRGRPAIYRAVRTQLSRPFGHVQRVGAITGFAEAPSLSADGRTLYYHELVGSQFRIQSVTRP
jgi:hypothetical protein